MNSSNRKLNVRYQPGWVDHMLEGLAVLVEMVIWICIYRLYLKEGNVSPEVWTMGGTSLFSLILLGVCAYVPVRYYNFPFRVNERNMGVQYALAVKLIRGLNVVLGLMFLACVFVPYYPNASLFVSLSVVLMVILFIVYAIFAYKYR
ncbi:MAG: hypothetical protein Q4D56_08605 [Bacteroides sp.]|nr:hypothetical protein [Bacteroides sp.]